MATATVTLSGATTLAAPVGRDVALSIGPGVAIGSVPWNTSNASRSKVNWLPSAQTPFLNSNGTVSRPWYQFFTELAENRMGGIGGVSIPQVATTIVQTQEQVVATAAYTDQAVAYTRGVAASVEATAEVAQNAGLPGASSIPPNPDPPVRPRAGTVLA